MVLPSSHAYFKMTMNEPVIIFSDEANKCKFPNSATCEVLRSPHTLQDFTIPKKGLLLHNVIYADKIIPYISMLKYSGSVWL